MSNDRRCSLLARLSWLLSALLCLSGCIGTETGNPPVIDKSLLSVTVRGEQLEISGAAGAVLPGGSTLVIINLNDNGEVDRFTTEEDGSFRVLVGKHVRPALQAENEHGKSKGQAAPPPQVPSAPSEPSGDGGAAPPTTDVDSSVTVSPVVPVTPDASSLVDSGAPSRPAADASVSTVSSTGNASVASITANGTGCPSGAWSVSQAADGTALGVDFLGYEARVEPNTTSFAIKDCMLALKVDGRPGETYALTSALYTGSASVGAGTNAELSTSYAFQGDPSASTTGGQSFASQAAAAFTFQDDIPESSLVWSPCGVTRDLNITTRLRVTGGVGSVSLAKLSGIKLATRACTSGAAVGSTN